MIDKKSKFTKRRFSSLILFLEIFGILLVIIVLWLDELLDLPHNIFGTMATPVNYSESILETLIILIFAIPVLIATSKILKKIQYLEGLLIVCSYCKKIKTENSWVPVEEYMSNNTAADFSHGLCPACLKEHYKYHSD